MKREWLSDSTVFHWLFCIGVVVGVSETVGGVLVKVSEMVRSPSGSANKNQIV